ncbi:MAG: 4-alpha-glucanotransferase, partial [Bacillota bacterium]|nr:4-alpha-glucanotransferase [Bacillota bacterium]
VDYHKLYKNKYKILKLVYKRSYKEVEEELKTFYRQEKKWLRPFALFMSLKEHHLGRSWLKWDDKFRKYDSKEVKEFEKDNQEKLFFWIFTQFYFYKQWAKVKEYANDKEIKIIGDLPIYVAEDSADIWSNNELFKLDDKLVPEKISGVPPDLFSKTGQLWGNPIYDWQKLKEKNYSWWVRRIKHSFKLYDRLRIDHFRGFQAYWEVDYRSKNAVDGKWVKGPGIDFFNSIKKQLGELDIIAEDLGYLTEEVRNLIKETGYPGMKVLQFAFDGNSNNDYLPHNYRKNAVVYTGTHDNDTTKSWFKKENNVNQKYILDYINIESKKEISWNMIITAWSSTADLAIATMQDFLSLDNEARMNTPSTDGDNWKWRMNENDLNKKLSLQISYITRLYGR